MAIVIEIKTPNCSRCKMFEPEYQKIQSEHPEHEYKVLVFGQDSSSMEYATKYSIKSAPTFIIEQDGKETIIVKQEELKQTIESL